MNEVIKNMLERRSVRKYKKEQIKEEELDLILKAGLYAPSAGSRQGVLFVVSQDRETNEKLGRIKKAHFNGRISDDKIYISKEQPSIADDVTIMNAFYDAPTVVTLFAPKNFVFAESDCSIAAENMLLAATSIGIGSCYIGAAWESFDDTFGQEILKKWEVRTDYRGVCHIILGYPLDEHKPVAKPRKEGRIIRV